MTNRCRVTASLFLEVDQVADPHWVELQYLDSSIVDTKTVQRWSCLDLYNWLCWEVEASGSVYHLMDRTNLSDLSSHIFPMEVRLVFNQTPPKSKQIINSHNLYIGHLHLEFLFPCMLKTIVTILMNRSPYTYMHFISSTIQKLQTIIKEGPLFYLPRAPPLPLLLCAQLLV